MGCRGISDKVLMPGQPGNPSPSQQSNPGTPPHHGSPAGTPGMVSTGLGGPSPVAAPATGPLSGPPHHVCCETGRPVLADPLTGQTVCSCQYDAQLLNYQRLAASGLPLNMYGTAAAAAAAAAAAYGGEQGFLPLGSEQSAFYSPSANGFDLKENLEAWRSLQPYAASMYYPYESAALAGYPFANGYGVDLNGARRKNATRETTATLKAWLSEHRKNPYPTKGEKIMLAIITKMTLTQVSTWFANARRRLKKENKMTWSPRNRCDDDDDDDDRERPRDSKDSGGVQSSGKNGDSGDMRKGHHDDQGMRHAQFGSHHDEDDRLKDGLDDLRHGIVDIDEDSKSSDPGLMRGLHHIPGHPSLPHPRLQGPSSLHRPMRGPSGEKGKSPGSPASDGGSPVASDSESSTGSLLSPSLHDGRRSTTELSSSNPKPRIWSIVDTATSGNPGPGVPIPASHGMEGLSTLQRVRLDYLTNYQKSGAAPSWYGPPGSAPPGVSPSGVPAGSFPLYAFPPTPTSSNSSVNSGQLVHNHGNLDANQSAAAAAAVAASLNRLRTVHGFGDQSKANSSFSFVTSRLHPTAASSTPSGGSGSSAAIAAVAGSLNPMTSMANKVVS